MARYKDVENIRKLFDNEYKSTRKLINEGETHLDNLAEGFSEATRVLDMLPTADVVPKSEYDAVVTALDNTTKEFLKLHDVYQEQQAKVKRLEHILESYSLQYGTVRDKYTIIKRERIEEAKEIFGDLKSNIWQYYNKETLDVCSYEIAADVFNKIEQEHVGIHI